MTTAQIAFLVGSLVLLAVGAAVAMRSGRQGTPAFRSGAGALLTVLVAAIVVAAVVVSVV